MQDWGLYACYRMWNWSQPLAGRSKRIDTKVSILLGLQFPLFLSLTHTGERRPLRKGVRQRIFSSAGAHIVRPFPCLYAVSDTLLLHISATLRKRNTRRISRRAREATLGCSAVQPICTLLHRRVNLHFQFSITASHTKKAPLSRCFQSVDKVNLSFLLFVRQHA